MSSRMVGEHRHAVRLGRALVAVAAVSGLWVQTAHAQASSADMALSGVSGVSDINPSLVHVDWTLTNAGPADATDVTLAVILPEGVALVDAWIAATPDCTFDETDRRVTCQLADPLMAEGSNFASVAFLNTDNAAGSTLVVEGTVTAEPTDPDASNNSASVTVTVPGGPVPVTPGTEAADLALRAKTQPPSSFFPAGTGSLTWDIVNAGPSPAENVSLVVTIPDGLSAVTGNVSTIACEPFDEATRQLRCVVPGPQSAGIGGLLASVFFSTVALAAGDEVVVTATVSSDTPDPNPGNNQATGAFVMGSDALPVNGATTVALALGALAALAIGIVLTTVARRQAPI